MCAGRGVAWTIIILLLAVATGRAAAEEVVDLLRLPTAVIEASSLPGNDVSGLTQLTYATAKPAVSLDVPEGASLDITYGFGGDTVAPESVRITLPENPNPNETPARVEVLVSTASPNAGFHSLRTDPLDPKTHVQSFTFPAAAARWIMVRLTPAHASSKLSVRKIEVLGHAGMPISRYAFAESPARAIDILTKLEQTNQLNVGITPVERDMFARIKQGRPNAAEFATIALFASGVPDTEKQRAYLRRLDALEQQARLAVASGKTPAERGTLLLRWLHEGVMAKGYRTDQTDLSVLLDTGTFNCVSSAMIYNILALSLGLDARAIEVPDHAFSVLYDGTNHMDVETTNANGFNPARDKQAIDGFEKLTGFHYIPDTHRDQRREVNEAGLAALIYYNHGVDLTHQKRYADALLAYFRAMSLDPESASSAKNALAVLANWGLELTLQEKWQNALDVIAIGLTLAPHDATLTNNHAAIWSRWATHAIDAGQPEEAIAILKRAEQTIPGGGFTAMQAWVYIKPGEVFVKTHDWPAAFRQADEGIGKLDPVPAKELTHWRNELYLRWFNSEIDAHHFDEATRVLEQGLAANPSDRRLQNDAGYLAQEWSNFVGSRDGGMPALAVLRSLETRFPTIEAVPRSAANHVRRTVAALIDSGRVDDALAVLNEARDVLLKPADVQEIGASIYDTAARQRIKSQEWEGAADFYARGLAQFPDNHLLLNNVAWLAQQWQMAAYARGGASAVLNVARAMTAKFPAVPNIAESGRDQMRRAVAAQVGAANYPEALRLVDESQSFLKPVDIQSLYEIVYDEWAKKRMAEKAWRDAASIYVQGLARAGGSSLLTHNAGFLTQQWGKDAYLSGGADQLLDVVAFMTTTFPGVSDVSETVKSTLAFAVGEDIKKGAFEAAVTFLDRATSVLAEHDLKQLYEHAFDKWARASIDKKDWVRAITIYDEGLKKIPNDPLFTQNRAYCAAQKQ